SVRFVAEWSLLAAPTIAFALDSLGEWLAPALARPRRAMQLAAALFVIALAGEAARERRGQPLSIGLSQGAAPFAAIDFVTRHGLRDRLYADLDVGCYLL